MSTTSVAANAPTTYTVGDKKWVVQPGHPHSKAWAEAMREATRR